MTPEDYAGKYLRLTVVLPDGTVNEVAINKYLNTGDVYMKPEKATPRELGAVAEYSRLCGKVQKLLGQKLHSTFQVDGWGFSRKSLQSSFSGKGSPAEILDVFWLANRCEMVDAAGLQDYADKFLGVDCNGFVGNYIGQHMPVGSFHVKPYKDFTKIKQGDVIVFYAGPPVKVGKHVAAVGEIFELKGKQLIFNVADSGGPDEGVKVRQRTHNLLKDETGLVYFQGDRRGYFSEGPPKKGHNAWARFRAPGLAGTVIQVARDFLAESLVVDAVPEKKKKH